MSHLDLFPGWEKIEAYPMSSEELDAAFEEVMTRSRALESYLSRERVLRRRKAFRIVAVAASVCALVAIPLLSIRWARQSMAKEQVAVQYIQRSTTSGETAEVVLPDESRVVLNAQSVLIYPDQFVSGDRKVFLSGEAVFDVTASEEKPFYVQTSDLTVKVHGTHFNVKAYFDDPSVTATLRRSAISVWSNDDPQRVVELAPEQFCNWDRGTGALVKGHADSAEAMSWENGSLCFRSESIQGIIRAIQRRYGVQIYLTTDKYNDTRISARFVHGETVDELLSAICSVVPSMRYTSKDGAIYIR